MWVRLLLIKVAISQNCCVISIFSSSSFVHSRGAMEYQRAVSASFCRATQWRPELVGLITGARSNHLTMKTCNFRVSVSRAVRPVMESSRPVDFYSQKAQLLYLFSFQVFFLACLELCNSVFSHAGYSNHTKVSLCVCMWRGLIVGVVYRRKRREDGGPEVGKE